MWEIENEKHCEIEIKIKQFRMYFFRPFVFNLSIMTKELGMNYVDNLWNLFRFMELR